MCEEERKRNVAEDAGGEVGKGAVTRDPAKAGEGVWVQSSQRAYEA